VRVVRVKVCGISRREDADLAVALGAHALGFVFWPGSPRVVAADAVREITRTLPPFVEAVGVFVNQAPADVRDITARAGLTAIQLHGDEAPEAFVARGVRVIKAIGVGRTFSPDAVAAVPPSVTVLLDIHDPVRRGGTGQTIDWEAAADAARRRPVILAGGLTADNVRQAVETVQPYAVDVSSGVEAAPGVKDAVRLRAFFAALQGT
jgi:phosphoribosylanthranilate isomerase